MRPFINLAKRVQVHLRAHRSRTLPVAIPLLALIVLGVLWACGLFTRFSYLPDRAYILGDPDAPEPETLQELLQSERPQVETLLRKPAVAAELLSAASLETIIDSRQSLNNLRRLDEQLEGRLKELSPPAEAEEPSEEETALAAGRSKEGDAETEQPAGAEAPQAERTAGDSRPEGPAIALVYQPGDLQETEVASPQEITRQIRDLNELKKATERLLLPPGYLELINLPVEINLKGVWQSPGEALLHITPAGDWLPEEGYRLYRVVNGRKELIAEKAASPEKALSGKLGHPAADIFQELYRQATLTPEKLTTLEMSAGEFRDLVYRVDTLNAKPQVSGELDFLAMQKAQITIPPGNEQKIPDTDRLLEPIYIQGRAENGNYHSAQIRTALWKNFTVSPGEPKFTFDSLQALPEGEAKINLIQEVLAARGQVETLCFVDEEFAEAAGFLIRDDLSALGLAPGTKISYLVEAPGEIRAQLHLTEGVENSLGKPLGLIGYGLDGKVPLRWQQAADPRENNIISGYFIERKLDGEDEFTLLNEEPIVVAYQLDETDIYFESPVFYEDEVDNGRQAQYRLRSLDIFGRRSEYSDILSVKVEKVTPPNAPSISPPLLNLSGTEDAEEKPAAVQQSLTANRKKKGIALPVFSDSADTVRFTIYRAEAVGAKSFGPPQVIANLIYENPEAGRAAEPPAGEGPKSPLPKVSAEPSFKMKRVKGAKQTLLTSLQQVGDPEPSLVYFDSKIKKGHSYKYWVSAWDSWNNESAWSPSVSAGVPSEVLPKTPNTLEISMLSRELPDYSLLPPGIYNEGPVSQEGLKKSPAVPMRQYETDTATIRSADSLGLRMGSYLTGTNVARLISLDYDNLPADKYIHMFLAVRGEDVLPNGTARLKWPAHSGDGLAGYAVYTPQFPLLPLEEMQEMSRAELAALGPWKLVNGETFTQNQLVVGGLSQAPGDLSLFLICLQPQSSLKPGDLKFQKSGVDLTQISTGLNLPSFFLEGAAEEENPEGGYVKLAWSVPADPQVKFYRVYRAEVPSFKKPVDESALEWTLVGDNITAPTYTERVEQSFAHYYYYKVTAVTPWAVESKVGAVERFRVPSTKPPQAPRLLLPLSRKDGVKINFSPVEHCDRYEIYRAEIPRVAEEDLAAIDGDLLAVLFNTPSESDKFITNMLNSALNTIPATISPGKPLTPLTRINTLSQRRRGDLLGGLANLGDQGGLAACRQVLDKFGPLALMDYRDLSLGMLNRVKWIKVGELPAGDDPAKEVDPAGGLIKPLSIIDETAVYGITYLYTVQAWNDDNLGSSRPEPVEGTPRRSGPFDPIGGLKGEIKEGKPRLNWNTPTMANLSWEQCRWDTAGYIVYRAGNENGPYYQAGPLLFETNWTDEEADLFAFNWYRVKVLDTGGYLSEFSEPVLVHRNFISDLKTVIPPAARLSAAPKITIAGRAFSVKEGIAFKVPYELTGSEPITLTVKATGPDGQAAAGFAVDPGTNTVTAAGTLKAGLYSVTVSAKNSAGEDTASFQLTVEKTTGTAETVTPPRLTIDGRSFRVKEGTPFEKNYSLTGTEPITITVKAAGPDGGTIAGFSVNRAAATVSAAGTLSAGTYNVTVTARNKAGEDTALFSLTVERAPLIAPKLAERRDEYRFSISRLVDYSEQLSAGGSEPLTWSLEPISERMSVPEQARIDQDGLLTVSRFIPEGNHSFLVKVANEAGSDTREIYLEVKSTQILPKPVPGPSGAAPQYLSLAAGPAFPGPAARLLQAAPTPWRDDNPLPSRQLPPVQQSGERSYKGDNLKCLEFRLSGVDLSCPPNMPPQLAGLSGTAFLRIGEKSVPVSIQGATINKTGSGDIMETGTVYLKEAVELPNIGLTLVSMNISPQEKSALVSGYLKSLQPEQNLVGDRAAIVFEEARLRPGMIIISKNLPRIRYEQFTIQPPAELTISLEPALTDYLLMLGSGSRVSMKSHLETLNNEGVEFVSPNLSFDLQGRISGTLQTKSGQSLQHLVPGGAALRIDEAVLVFAQGVSQPASYLEGRLILPFEQAGTAGSGAPGVYVGGHPDTNIVDELLAKITSGEPLDQAMREAMEGALLKFGETVQQNSLLVVSADPVLQDLCSFIPVRVNGWNGKGFLLESTTMTPTSVTERSLTMDQQRLQAITVAPTAVSVDLDREGFLPIKSAPPVAGEEEIILTPKETEEPFWVGLVMHGGTLTLPEAFIKTRSHEPIAFELARGEMIYDLNGFNYQTYLYNDEGIPAAFEEELAGFPEVWVYDCLLDLYANRVNLEINAEVAVDLFLKNRLKVKLYTNQEDNANGKKGEFLCSVAPTKEEDFLVEDIIAKGIDLEVSGGWIRNDGLHLHGALVVKTAEMASAEPLAFTDMLVPAEKEKTNRDHNPQGKYANVPLDRPVNVDFHGFTMEIRALDLEHRKEGNSAWLQFNLHGATLLAENIPLLTESDDQVAVKCYLWNKPQKPIVAYEESCAVLEATFDDCIELTGLLVPKPLEGGGGDGLIEYDTEKLGLSFLNQLDSSPVQTEARFGYDTQKERCYFAVGIGFYQVPIHFGVGSLKDFTGIVAYNMTIERDEKGLFQFPGSASQMKGFIKGLPVHREEGTNFAAGLGGTLTVLELCEIRTLYFCFESGPIVTAGGRLCLPLDVGAMVSRGNSSLYTEIGQVDILYSHPERYFSFTMAFPEQSLIVAKVSGTLGFEYSPHLFGVNVGYPEMLRGNIGSFDVGAGVGFLVDGDGDSLARARLELGLRSDVDVHIVYLSGYLYAGADGTYYFDMDKIELELYLVGGIKGGIRVASRKYNIIAFHLDARGDLTASAPYTTWDLGCSARVSYHLNLGLKKVSGSVNAKFDTEIGW